MEIVFLPGESLKIKGKHVTFVVDPKEKSTYDAAIILNFFIEELSVQSDAVIINGPGEYEISGAKISGTRNGEEVIYKLNIDGVDILLGRLGSLEKQQHRLNEQNIVVAYVDKATNASFVTSLASNVVIFYGEKANSLTGTFGKENIKTVQRYTATLGKLPAEVETVILQ